MASNGGMVRQTIKSLLRPRIWFALSLGLAVALVAYNWPSSPRAAVQCEHGGWHFAFSHDSTKLAVLDREPGLTPAAQILLVDVATGHVVRRLDIGQSPFPHRVVFAPDGGSVGVLGTGVVTTWDPNTGRMIGRYDHPEWSHDPDHYAGREILFSPAGRWLLHDVHDGRVCDVETGEIVNDYHERLPDRERNVHGGCVAALVGDEVKTFDVLTGAELGRFATLRPRPPILRLAFTFSRDGTHGILFTDTDQWAVHNAIDGRARRLFRAEAGVYDICLSADNRYAAVSLPNVDSNTFAAWPQRLFTSRTSVRVFDTTSGAEVGQSIRDGFKICFAPDGHTLAVADMDKHLTLWDWPPPSRWPSMLIATMTTALLSYGVGFAWSRRGRGSGRGVIQ
jgi:WD40 repeat protein